MDSALTTTPTGSDNQPTAFPEQISAGLRAAHLDEGLVAQIVARTLDEDLAWGPDVTTEAIFGPSQRATGVVLSRQSGCLAGIPIGAAVVWTLAQRQGDHAQITLSAHDGQRVSPGDQIMVIEASLRCLLTAERSMLNLVGQLSGVASATAAWVDAVDGTHARIRDTRKTVPGLRVLQKYAVVCGGGVNHRMGLGDAALIKDNHIAAAGSVTAALAAVRDYAPQIACEVECDTLDQVREAVAAGAELILLDNMAPAVMAEAVELCRPTGVLTEASGGLTLGDARAVAATGVDYISVGALTHSSTVLDLGLDL